VLVELSSSDTAAWLESASAAVELLCRRGLLRVLAELVERSLRHNELARGTGMDSKQLSRALRHALSADLIERYVGCRQMPVTVRYQLTPRGKDLIAALAPLAAWYESDQRQMPELAPTEPDDTDDIISG
jgi:DNA-binding HxlR family transcriptional regulator